MRYVVTGAAGFIGSQLAEALRRGGPRGRRRRLLHRLLRPGREGGERARARRAAPRPRRGDARPRRRRRRLPSRRRSPACAASATSSRVYVRRNVLATQRVFEAARRGRRARRVRVVVVGLRRGRGVPDAGGRRAAADLAVRDHEARAASTSRTRTRRGFGLDAVVLRYFTVYGPRQRPDMFFRRVCDALARRRRVRDLRQRRAVAQLHLGRRRRRRDDRGDGARRPPAPSTTSAAATRRRCSRRSRCSSGSPAGRSTCAHVDAAKGDVARTNADVDAHPRRRSAGSRATTPRGRLGQDVVMGLR